MLLPKTGRIKGWGFLSYLYLTQKKPDGLWRLLGDNHKLNQVALPITTAAPGTVFYCRNQQTVAYGMQLLTRKMLFPSIPIVKKIRINLLSVIGKNRIYLYCGSRSVVLFSRTVLPVPPLMDLKHDLSIAVFSYPTLPMSQECILRQKKGSIALSSMDLLILPCFPCKQHFT